MSTLHSHVTWMLISGRPLVRDACMNGKPGWGNTCWNQWPILWEWGLLNIKVCDIFNSHIQQIVTECLLCSQVTFPK